ncbi:alpha/beta hydrolase [Streptomyces sp. NPDC002790]|uniref:alpha/beta fold hydrolase n=1 Tax=Streptomyces sp. NPDC002790 TaxID=3154431 RepID=UPI003333666F
MGEYDATHSSGTHVVHDGPREAPPLLLIHGSGASGSTWDPVVPLLAGHHHVIRVDLPGCGHSPPAPTYDVPAQTERVARVLDGLGLRHVAVGGHSSGGYIATALAESRPDLVRSLALVSTGPSPDALLPQPLLHRVLLAPPFGALLWARRSDAMIRKGMAMTAARPVNIPDNVVADVRDLEYRTLRAMLRHYTEYVAERSVPERLAALDVPVLVLFGTADPRWDPASAHRYEAVPGARVELLPGVGHLAMFEDPAGTGEPLLAFTSAAGDLNASRPQTRPHTDTRPRTQTQT